MATKNQKINVVFEEITANLIAHLAQKEQKSVESLVQELALEALEMREDLYFSRLADQLDKKEGKLYGHKEAWEQRTQ